MSNHTTVIETRHVLTAQPSMLPSLRATTPFFGSLQTLMLVCSVAGQVVAFRLAIHGEAQKAAQHEAAVCQPLQTL